MRVDRRIRAPMKKVLLLAIVAMAVACTETQRSPGEQSAATVYGREITMRALDRQVAPFLGTRDFQKSVAANSNSEVETLAIQRDVLTRIITREVLKREAEQLHVSAPSGKVSKLLQQFRRREGLVSDQKYRRYVEALGHSAESFRELFRFEVLKRELHHRIAADSRPSQSELRAYYSVNRDLFTRSRALYILLSPMDTALAKRLSKLLATVPPRHIRSRFARLAHKYSQDASGNRGGQLGWLMKGSLSIVDPALERALAHLPEGEVSEPIESPRGLAIVYVLRREVAPFKVAREQVLGEAVKPVPDLIHEYMVEAYKDADIEVNERFGVFDLQAFEVTDKPGTP